MDPTIGANVMKTIIITFAILALLITSAIACRTPEPNPEPPIANDLSTVAPTAAPTLAPTKSEQALVPTEPLPPTDQPTMSKPPTEPPPPPPPTPLTLLTTTPGPPEQNPPPPPGILHTGSTPTTTPHELPTTPISSQIDAQTFLAALSTSEEACITRKLEGRTLKAALNSTDPMLINKFLPCLQDESQYQLFLLAADPEYRTIPEAAQRCIWDGLKPAFLVQPDPNDVDQGYQYFGAFILGSIIVAAYCTPDLEAQISGEIDPQDVAELRCTVELLGGPRGFMETALMGDPEFSQTLEEAGATCRQNATETPLPNP